jgi:hypothetical protein
LEQLDGVAVGGQFHGRRAAPGSRNGCDGASRVSLSKKAAQPTHAENLGFARMAEISGRSTGETRAVARW